MGRRRYSRRGQSIEECFTASHMTIYEDKLKPLFFFTIFLTFINFAFIPANMASQKFCGFSCTAEDKAQKSATSLGAGIAGATFMGNILLHIGCLFGLNSLSPLIFYMMILCRLALAICSIIPYTIYQNNISLAQAILNIIFTSCICIGLADIYTKANRDKTKDTKKTQIDNQMSEMEKQKQQMAAEIQMQQQQLRQGQELLQQQQIINQQIINQNQYAMPQQQQMQYGMPQQQQQMQYGMPQQQQMQYGMPQQQMQFGMPQQQFGAPQ